MNLLKYCGCLLSGACPKTEVCNASIKGRFTRCKGQFVRGRGTNKRGVGPEEKSNFLRNIMSVYQTALCHALEGPTFLSEP